MRVAARPDRDTLGMSKMPSSIDALGPPDMSFGSLHLCDRRNAIIDDHDIEAAAGAR